MTKEESASVLTILRTAYPNFYRNMKASDGELTLGLWAEMFKGDNLDVVKLALYKLIETHTGFPPDIAAVKEKIRELVAAATGEPTDEELWLKLKDAASRGSYDSNEEFQKLPPILQTYCGSPATLRELAREDIQTLDTVRHGQFLKQIGNIRDRKTYAASLDESVKQAVARIYKPMPEADAIEAPANANLLEVHS